MRAVSAVLAATALAAHAAPDPDLDPTVLHSRVKLTNEFVDREFDVSENTTKLALSYAFGHAARRDWTVQLDLPLVAYRAGTLGGAPDATHARHRVRAASQISSAHQTPQPPNILCAIQLLQ